MSFAVLHCGWKLCVLNWNKYCSEPYQPVIIAVYSINLVNTMTAMPIHEERQSFSQLMLSSYFSRAVNTAMHIATMQHDVIE
jgi:hypothetical protein